MAPSPVEELALLDLERSNKGASKQRRDQINNEIGTMRDLLPLPESSRQRLSQLQIMSLSCVFIRKCNILQKLFNATPGGSSDSPCDFSQSLTGFLLVTTRDGKLVYISENVTEYLGHSMVDMKTQGDSLFDIVDKRDHGTVRAQLLHGAGEVDPDKEVAFFCRMNMSRTLKRQAGFGDVKVMHVKGHFATVPGQDPGTEQQVFMAVCSPLITPDIKESLIQNNTMVFKSVHQLDMNFIELTENGEYHLGVSNDEVCNKSWYSYLHPEDIYEAREKHVQLIKSRHEMGCMMTVRMITSTNEIIWVNIVMHVRQALLSNSDDPVILCINQVISEKEAYQFKVQGQLFALYAARSPDFFFGTAFCAPITPAMENVMSPPSSILPSPFFSRQQPFDNTITAQTPPFMQNAVPPNQTAMFMKNGYQPNIGRQGHTDTLKALKRKIQENYTCKPPMKVPRMVNGIANRNTYSPPQDTTPLPSSFESNIYRNSFGPMVGGGDHHRGMGQGPMQVMYAHNLSTVMMSPKEKSYMPDVFPHKPMYEEKCLEQVVPDVTVPACYLTPEPSPVSSPEPPKKCEAVHTVKDGKLIDPVLIAKHLCALKQKQLNPNSNMNPNGEPRKLLPSLDAFYVDSFFNEIDNVSLTREEEIRLLENVAKEKVTIKEEPLDQDSCKENTEPLTNGFDIEEFLQFTEKSKDEVVQVKVESRTDDQQVMSFENSPCPSSPYSTISAADEKFSSDDLSSFALTPESGFESDSLDDVLDPDCWDLESVKMDMSMTSTQPTLPAFRMTQDLHPEPELYQLKQLISSCTPSGMQDFTEDSQ